MKTSYSTLCSDLFQKTPFTKFRKDVGPEPWNRFKPQEGGILEFVNIIISHLPCDILASDRKKNTFNPSRVNSALLQVFFYPRNHRKQSESKFGRVAVRWFIFNTGPTSFAYAFFVNPSTLHLFLQKLSGAQDSWTRLIDGRCSLRFSDLV